MENEHFEDADACLIRACIRKDQKAWTVLAGRYSGLIYAAIENRLNKYGVRLSRHDIDDISQITLAAIWRDDKLKKIRSVESFPYWLAMVAGNEALEYLRRMARNRIPLFRDEESEKDPADIIDTHYGMTGPRDEAHKNDLSRRISESIASLPTKERLIAKLHLIHGKKYREIALILNIPGGTVSVYLRRSKAKLKENLKYLL